MSKLPKHTANYFRAFGYDESSVIICELCGLSVANQIHHVEPRSAFGSTRKDDQDVPSNLCALCYKCHERAHGPECKTIKMTLKQIISKRDGPQTKGL